MKDHARALGRLFVCAALAAASLTHAAPARAQQGTRTAATAQPARGTDADAELKAGKSLLRRGKAAEALVRLENARGLFEKSGSVGGQAAVRDLLGELYERQGLYPAALEHFRKALVLFAAKDASDAQTKDAARSMAARANVPGTSTASNLDIDSGDYHANLMLAKIGNMHVRQNQLAEARRAYGEMKVQKIKSGGGGGFLDKVAKATAATIVTGEIQADLTLPTAAAFAGMTAKEQLELYRKAITYAMHETGMGRVDYGEGQFAEARKHFENAVEATKSGLPGIGNLGQTRRFRAAARTALGDVALSEAGRAAPKDQAKFYREAAKQYEQAIDGAKKDARPDLMWPAQRGRARALWMQAALEKDTKKAERFRDDALAAYDEAIKTIEALRQDSLRADEARTTFFATTKDVFDEATAAFADAALALAPGGAGAPLEGRARELAATAFRFAEQGRARSLLDLLSESGDPITRDIPEALRQEKQRILDEQQEIAAQLTGFDLAGATPKESPADLEARLSKLQEEYDSVENRIKAASPRYGQLVSAQPLPLAEVQQKVLDDGTALVEYSLGKEASYLWAVTGGDFRLFKLPGRAAINESVTRLLAQIIPAEQGRALLVADSAGGPERGMTLSRPKAVPAAADFAAAAHALYKVAVEPAAALVGTSRLLVVADGALAYVPFEVLLTDAPTAGAGYSALPYLIRKNEVVYAPSASVIAASRQHRPVAYEVEASTILLIADPVFNADDERAGGLRASGNASAQGAASRGLTLGSAVADVSGVGGDASSEGVAGGGFKLARLPGTREEATQIGAAARAAGMKSDVWLSLDAKESSAATRDLTQYRVVHFATHGLLNTERPQFTGLVLSLVGDADADGFLRTNEVFNLRLGRPLVMLSACETGLGRERRGEGVVGLTRAFMYAGASAVGVTLWSVNDRSTAALMTDFYRRLLSKDKPAPTAALRDARTKMIDDGKYSAPFHWAPFVLVGDWRR
ncbi:MAG TPA: CHAT domain-containing protein [Pyrinomonadaceae bacterium]|nr:CHAT domain-containing protein [Pyrinomonadaceae bacterium]